MVEVGLDLIIVIIKILKKENANFLFGKQNLYYGFKYKQSKYTNKKFSIKENKCEYTLTSDKKYGINRI